MQPNLVTFENFNVNGQSRFRLERPEGTDFEAFGGHIEIDSGSSVSQSANLFRAERSASLAYTPDQQMTLPELVESVITPFNQFIEFANGRPLHLSKLTAH